MEGISSRQGLHQVAQKFRNTTFPRKSERRISFSFKSGSVKSGATLPTVRGSYLELCIHTTPNTSARIAIDTRPITSFDCTRGAVCSTGVVIVCSAIPITRHASRVSVQARGQDIHAPEAKDHH